MMNINSLSFKEKIELKSELERSLEEEIEVREVEIELAKASLGSFGCCGGGCCGGEDGMTAKQCHYCGESSPVDADECDTCGYSFIYDKGLLLTNEANAILEALRNGNTITPLVKKFGKEAKQELIDKKLIIKQKGKWVCKTVE